MPKETMAPLTTKTKMQFIPGSYSALAKELPKTVSRGKMVVVEKGIGGYGEMLPQFRGYAKQKSVLKNYVGVGPSKAISGYMPVVEKLWGKPSMKPVTETRSVPYIVKKLKPVEFVQGKGKERVQGIGKTEEGFVFKERNIPKERIYSREMVFPVEKVYPIEKIRSQERVQPKEKFLEDIRPLEKITQKEKITTKERILDKFTPKERIIQQPKIIGPPLPPPRIVRTPFGLPSSVLGRSFGGEKLTPGYVPELKVKGKFKALSEKALSFGQALNVGKRFAGGTSAATFRLKPVKQLVSGEERGRLGSQFYGKRGQSLTFVERTQYRIDSPGEKQEITQKGLSTLKGLRFFEKMKNRKSVKNKIFFGV
jgi:hypothetical protein